MPEHQRYATRVQADRHSIAAGRDININAEKFAARDYNEYIGEHEHEPEWSHPPAGSGLIRCPRCRRRHIAVEAVACQRCGYPQREMWEQELREQQEMTQRLAFQALVRKIVCWSVAGCLWWFLSDWSWSWRATEQHDMSNAIAAFCGWLICTGFTGELLVYGSIRLEGWLLDELPRLMTGKTRY